MPQSRERSTAQSPGASSPWSSSTVAGDLSSPRSSPSLSLSLFYLLFKIAAMSVFVLSVPPPLALFLSPRLHHTQTYLCSHHCFLGKKENKIKIGRLLSHLD